MDILCRTEHGFLWGVKWCKLSWIPLFGWCKIPHLRIPGVKLALFFGVFITSCKYVSHYCRQKYPMDFEQLVKSLRLEENGLCFPDYIFKCIFHFTIACFWGSDWQWYYMQFYQLQINQLRVILTLWIALSMSGYAHHTNDWWILSYRYVPSLDESLACICGINQHPMTWYACMAG